MTVSDREPTGLRAGGRKGLTQYLFLGVERQGGHPPINFLRVTRTHGLGGFSPNRPCLYNLPVSTGDDTRTVTSHGSGFLPSLGGHSIKVKLQSSSESTQL